MVRRLLNFLKKPHADLPDIVQPVVIRELDDKTSIHADFDTRGFSVVILRPKHAVRAKPNETQFGPYWPHSEQFGGYL